MPLNEVVELSRWQFALTAMYHFIFVPLTLGLSWVMVICESLYVKTGKDVYKDMTMFWGKLFGINFAMGVATGITMEFQFGTNWAYYSHYVGDIFGTPLAIEGLMAFFLESTFIGLFFFGWNRLSKKQHLMATFFVALGSNLSALWILVANGWMQFPAGAEFNPVTMRMELASLSEVFFNPVSQVKFLHTVSAAYMTASAFVLAISAWYLLKGRDTGFALRSFTIAAAFGLLSSLFTIVLGDESGYINTQTQPVKLALMEAEWETQPAPAGLALFAIPNREAESNSAEIKIPYVMGIMGTRSLSEEIKGLKDLKAENEQRIRNGMLAYDALTRMRAGDQSALVDFRPYEKDLGFGLLLKKYTENVVDASEAQIKSAAEDTIPAVGPMFWSFRIMVGLGVLLLFTFAASLWAVHRKNLPQKRWLLKLAMYSLPLPWIANELGWFVAEYGRQPWTITNILPTHLSASSIDVAPVAMSLIGFVVIYTLLLIVELYLMIKYVKWGPASLRTGRYFGEKSA